MTTTQTKASYGTVGMTNAARDLLRRTAVEWTTPAGARITLSSVLIAAITVATRHRDEFLDALRNS